jgi:hypothetical protein
VARPRRRWLRLALLVLPVAVAGLLLALGAALTCCPSWYEPPSIDYSRLQDDKRAQLRLENRISAALNDNRPVEFELDQAQVNRWIAARHELWPAEAPSFEPFERPQVVLLDGNRLRVGALLDHAGMQLVLSATLHLEAQPDGLVVNWDALRAGALPVPRRLIAGAARRLTDRLELDSQALFNQSITLPVEATWPNGKRRFRIADLSIRAGVMRVSLEPL